LCLALAANAVNLLDLRPGRALKAFSASCLVLVPEVGQLGAAALFGAGCALLPEDLGERAMLGDAGSNALGFALGFWTLELPLGVTLAVLALLAGLHVYAERGSLSALIDAVGPLRYLDRLGRRPYP
jgi:UDP-N-acetylmuramyl pentapeptide phosphotransferase/UDP-N-acetylglucosamine-1-phosphate transferase